jgi:predicted signal transduction protein with EAL and GGDEF domain
MLIFRWAILLLLLVAGVSFAFYAGTGQPKFKRFGWIVLKWTLLAAFGFFAVLIAERAL